ncbi:unnamed protein product [Acanthosepion pharaonis]|uniref:Uncharacterized protein n=1 Tax=Acanthosepion pharaonis TaxID=158019 RepID=A0A812BEH0_ACAPH|nr:unnamed protein product [Sepia pharaonis]
MSLQGFRSQTHIYPTKYIYIFRVIITVLSLFSSSQRFFFSSAFLYHPLLLLLLLISSSSSLSLSPTLAVFYSLSFHSFLLLTLHDYFFSFSFYYYSFSSFSPFRFFLHSFILVAHLVHGVIRFQFFFLFLVFSFSYLVFCFFFSSTSLAHSKNKHETTSDKGVVLSTPSTSAHHYTSLPTITSKDSETRHDLLGSKDGGLGVKRSHHYFFFSSLRSHKLTRSVNGHLFPLNILGRHDIARAPYRDHSWASYTNQQQFESPSLGQDSPSFSHTYLIFPPSRFSTFTFFCRFCSFFVTVSHSLSLLYSRIILFLSFTFLFRDLILLSPTCPLFYIHYSLSLSLSLSLSIYLSIYLSF